MNDLERVLNPGVARLNWNALGVLDFVAMCNNVSLVVIAIVVIVALKHSNLLSKFPL